MPHVILAFDRQTARSFDADGRMRVKDCILSTAEINPYYGKEIPGYESLGLKPETVYELYRDPAELKRAADTFNGVPLMIKHVPQTAADPRKEYIGGSVHSVRFDGKHLRGDLLVMDGHAIDLIQSEKLSDLSCGYRYKPDMVSGSADGKKYDGVMIGIEGNHVALVDDGRASNAHVADAALQPPQISTKGAIDMAFPNENGAPGAGAGAQPGSPEGEQNEQMNMQAIGQALKQIATLLQDIHGKVGASAPQADTAGADNTGMSEGENDPRAGMDEAEETEHEGKAKDEELSLEPATKEIKLNDGAEDESVDTDEGEKAYLDTKEQEGTPNRGNKTQFSQTGAMDAKSVRNVVANAVKAERERAHAAAEAKRDVMHVLGDIAMDDASDIYREALIQSGIDVAGVPKSGMRAIWQGVAQARAQVAGAAPRALAQGMAMDSASKNATSAVLSALAAKISVKG